MGVRGRGVCGVGNLPVLKGLHPLGYFCLKINHNMKKLGTWLVEAEVVVVHLYALWHLIQALFFHNSCK